MTLVGSPLNMYIVIIFSVLLAIAEGNGVVKHVMEVDEPWPTGGLKRNTNYLECTYRHNFPHDPRWAYTYDIHCDKNEGESELFLSINYGNVVFDRFLVTSCEPEAVVNSVFPPKQREDYPSGEVDELGRPTVSYLKYKTEDGKCYARKYQYKNRESTEAKRFAPEEVDCPGKEGWSRFGEVAQFTDCRVPKLPLSKIVKNWLPSKPQDSPGAEHEDQQEALLECSFHQFSQYYSLKCTKGASTNEFFASVTYESYSFGKPNQRLLDRFAVTSCKEEDIIHGIFIIRETSANPKRWWSWVHKIWFSTTSGECHKRGYPEYAWWGPSVDAIEQDCPEFPDQWTNPTWGFAGQWRECKGPMSIMGRAKTQPEHSGAAQDHEQTNE